MLYEIELANGKCNRPKLAIVTAKDEERAKRKAERIHPGYRAADVRLVPSKQRSLLFMWKE